MNMEDRTSDNDNINEVQGNDSETETNIQEEQTGDGDDPREEVDIINEEAPDIKEEQIKRVLMSYCDKRIEEKFNLVFKPKEEEVREEIEEEPEEETLFNSFKEL